MSNHKEIVDRIQNILDAPNESYAPRLLTGAFTPRAQLELANIAMKKGMKFIAIDLRLTLMELVNRLDKIEVFYGGTIVYLYRAEHASNLIRSNIKDLFTEGKFPGFDSFEKVLFIVGGDVEEDAFSNE